MTEVSSTDQAAGADSSGRAQAPTRPPRTVNQADHEDVGTGLFSPGPATSAMPTIPDTPDELMQRGYGAGPAYPLPTTGAPAEPMTGIGSLPPVVGLPGDIAPPPPAP